MAGWRVGGVAGMARPGKQLSTGGKKKKHEPSSRQHIQGGGDRSIT